MSDYFKNLKVASLKPPRATDWNRLARNLETANDRLSEIGGIISRTGNFNFGNSLGDFIVTWQQANYQHPSTLWSASAPTRISVPLHWRRVQLIFQLRFSALLQKRYSLVINYKNAAGQLQRSWAQEWGRTQGGTANYNCQAFQVETPPVQVNGGFFDAQFNLRTSGGANATMTAGRSFFSIENLDV